MLKEHTKKRSKKSSVEEEKYIKEASKRKLQEYDLFATEYQKQQAMISGLEASRVEMQAYIEQ